MATDILEPIIDGNVPAGYVEIAEGDYTKIIQLETPYELEFVDKLADEGWVLVGIVPTDGVYTYWFQSKKKVYLHTRTQHQ